jgi:hypothetical protein
VSAGVPTLRLLGGEMDEERGLPRYDPGAALPAVVRLEADREKVCRAVYAVASWYVRGGGPVERGDSQQLRVSQGPIQPGTTVELPFDYPLPFYPWSYHGELVEIAWELEIRLDTPFSADHTVHAPFLLLPPPTDRARTGAATTKRGE